jgi:hypothetical protein
VAHEALSLGFLTQLWNAMALSRDESGKAIVYTRLWVKVAEPLKRHEVGG